MAQIGQIVELDSIEAVRVRISMFIGSRGVSQLVTEMAANAIDEILAGRNMMVHIFKKTVGNSELETEWYVRDWSTNGIPLKTNKGDDGIISIATKLFSGGKYDNFLYKSGSSGANGCGVCLVNALSKEFTVTTLAHDKDNNHIRYVFRNGILVDGYPKLIHLTPSPDTPLFSTEIKFTPDMICFEKNDTVDEDDLFRRLIVSKAVLPEDSIIVFNGKTVPNDYIERFKGESCVEMISSSYRQKDTNEYCGLDVAFYDSFDEGKIFQGIINTLESNEGIHKNVVNNLLKNKLMEIVEKTKRTVEPNDLLVPIRINCVLQVKHINFDEQVKSTFSNNRDELIPLITPCIESLIKNNKEFFDRVIDKAEEYRISLMSTRQNRKTKVGKAVQVAGLRDCSSRDWGKRSLYLVEGNSAAGSALKARDPSVDSIMALRGKVLNVLQAPKTKVLQNDVIVGLASALGYKLYQPVDPNKCRYSKIFIATDADNDGYHIQCLLTFTFFTLFPELIKQGMVYVVQCPLYGAVEGKKKFTPLFDEKSREEFASRKVVVRRFKGLGEMTADWLRVSMFDPTIRHCLQLKYSDFDMQKLWKEDLGKLNYEDVIIND